MRLIATLLFIASTQTFGQKLLQGKTPAWVTDYTYETSIADTTQTSDGYAYLLVSSQINVETNEFYHKYAMKITEHNGLSFVSSINEYFEPTFQKLIFHELNIIRNGQKINKLDLSKFEVIRREEDMERSVYDKSLNAIYNMPDVRVGDIVEYAFTRTGFNPIFDNHRFGYFYLQFSVPVARFAYRVIYSPERNLQFKSFNDTSNFNEVKTGFLLSREWLRDHVAGVLTDDQLPSWYNAFARVEYTDFQSWEDVKKWAMHIYGYPPLKNGDLPRVIESINKSDRSDEEKIKACIRIAQGQIRYLSFSEGIHGYKPHNPEMVYNQKYGDCKDKSFLLSYMLNKIGVKSAPALVSTENGYTLNESLPHPWAFNHCIVQFTHNDSTYWIDPTLRQQVGPLKSYYFPLYYHALVINNEKGELDSIPFGYKNSRIDVRETYSMLEIGGYVNLKVESTYYGDEADRIRNYFRTSSIDQINKDYLNFYAKDYSEIVLEKNVAFVDDTVQNVFNATEHYLVKNFWTIENNNKTATIYGSVLSSHLKKPETRLRKMPLAITHPTDISQTIKIKLPEEWTIEDTREKIESDAFLYEGEKYSTGKTITMRFHYKTKAGFIEANKCSEHVDKINEVLADNGYSIFTPVASESGKSRNAYVLIAMVVIAGIWALRRYRG